MGLDMTLYKKTYVKNWAHMNDDELHQVSVTKDHMATNIKPERVAYIVEEVAYWRKVNSVHKWFVDNVQGGEDDCRRAYVTSENLGALLRLVREVLEDHSKAEQLLPNEEGFFFGSTEYDEWYYKDLEETEVMLHDILGEKDAYDAEYEYHSSW